VGVGTETLAREHAISVARILTLTNTIREGACFMLKFSTTIGFVAIVLALRIVPNLKGNINDVQPAPLGKLIDVGGGRRVHLYCTGQGTPTVVVASGGFSFDWALVQPEIARLTRICTYDPAGTAWSDPLPAQTRPNCTVRVNELHELLNKARVSGPYVLVGFSIGGLVTRLYQAQYPDEIAGMAIVDHAFLDTRMDSPRVADAPKQMTGVDTPPVLIFQAPIMLDLEDDRNFSKLPELNRELHRWALSVPSFRPTPQMAAECFSEVEEATKERPFPLGNKPLVVVSTLNDSPNYRELQRSLVLLSHNSTQVIAANSTHMVIIDQPEIVVQAIQTVVAAARGQTK
jgi:pimeloyl-ACP methyl ester carboxylesterase